MSGLRQLKRRLEAAREAIEALDADLEAGRLTADEHERERAEREREVGRLFVSLRRAQREAREGEQERPEPPAPATATRPPWLRQPLTVGVGAALLLAVGITLGLGGGRWFPGPGRPPTPAGAPSPPGAAPSGLMPEIELQALRLAASGEDAPVPTLLQFAHVALDQGRLDEARQAYGRILAREPRNAEAITHLGAVLFREGRTDEALVKVEEALRIDPGYIHALWDRVEYLFHAKRDYPAAVKAADAFLRVLPDGSDADSIRKLRDQARQQAAKTQPLLPAPR